MNLSAYETCDVLVIGAGIAGIQAVHAAASAGCRVGLVSRGAICSGSSFYPGTWGLGLIGPENLADEAELTASILAVGRGMADPKLTASFVSGITPAVEALKKMGVQLKEAGEPGEREVLRRSLAGTACTGRPKSCLMTESGRTAPQETAGRRGSRFSGTRSRA